MLKGKLRSSPPHVSSLMGFAVFSVNVDRCGDFSGSRLMWREEGREGGREGEREE